MATHQSLQNQRVNTSYNGTFHSNCGINIGLSNSLKTATCISSDFDQKFILSARAIKPNEEVHLNFLQAFSDEPFTFGFSTVNPDQISNPFDFHDFRANSVTWTYEVKLVRDIHLSFSYNEEGDISYTLNGQTKTFPRRKIAGERHLWALMYLRGNGACVTLATPQEPSPITRAERVLPQIEELRFQSHNFQYKPLKVMVFTRFPDCGATQVWLFGERPIEFHERILIVVKRAPSGYQNNLLIGVTCYDPKHTDWDDMPTHSQLRNNEDVNWFKITSIPVNYMNAGDELAFSITPSLSLRLRKNNKEPEEIMVLDPELTGYGRYGLWPFVKITGEESMYVKMYSGLQVSTDVSSSQAAQERQETVTNTVERAAALPALAGPSSSAPSAEDIRKNVAEITTKKVNPPGPSSSSVDADQGECTICYEKSIDAVLYKCGHNCMCMPCAQKQWKGKGSSGRCPLCREPILDVIKLYK